MSEMAGEPTKAAQPTRVIEAGRVEAGALLAELWEYRAYFLYLLNREIKGRYRPTSLGRLWLFIRPLMEMGVYALIFGVFLGVKSAHMPFPLYLYSGVIVWIFLQNSLTRGAASLAGSRPLMDKIFFPRMIVPMIQVGANALDLCVAGLVIVLLVVWYALLHPIFWGGDPFIPSPGWALLAFPVFVLFLLAFVTASSLLMAVWQVYASDVGLILPVALRMLMYMSPVLYPATRIPEWLLPYFYLNPMAVLLDGIRWSLFGSPPPPMPQTIAAGIEVILMLLIAVLVFRRTERNMIDRL